MVHQRSIRRRSRASPLNAMRAYGAPPPCRCLCDAPRVSTDHPDRPPTPILADSDGSGTIEFAELESILKDDFGEEDIVGLATSGAAKSAVRCLTRPQTSPAARSYGGLGLQSMAAFRPATSTGGRRAEAGRHGLGRPATVPGGVSLPNLERLRPVSRTGGAAISRSGSVPQKLSIAPRA